MIENGVAHRKHRFLNELRTYQNNAIFLKARIGPSKANSFIDQNQLEFFKYARHSLSDQIKDKNRPEIINLLLNVRKALSVSKNPSELPLNEFFQSQIIEPICVLLNTEFYFLSSDITEEVVWILANVSTCSGENLKKIAKFRIFGSFKEYLSLPISEQIWYNIFWTLANFIAENKSFSDLAYNEGLWSAVFHASKILKTKRSQCWEALCWLFEVAMFCEYIPFPKLEDQILEELFFFVKQDLNEEAMNECLSGIASYLTKKYSQKQRAEIVSQANLEETLLKLLSEAKQNTKTTILVIFHRLVQGNSLNIKKFYSSWFLEALATFFNCDSQKELTIVLEIFYHLIQNIDNVFSDMLNSKIVDLICEQIVTNQHYILVGNSLDVLKAVIDQKSERDVNILLNKYELIGIIFQSLKHQNLSVITRGLELLESLLSFGEIFIDDPTQIIEKIKNHKDIQVFDSLITHPTSRISNFANYIATNFDLL